MRLILCIAVLFIGFGPDNSSRVAQAAECTASAPAYEIGPAEANRLYDCIQAEMIEKYLAASEVPGVADYREWRLLSTSPFVSATHGSLMINHHVNPIAAEIYTRWERMAGQRFPQGAILAKEGFRVAASGAVHPGPLFLMEKAAPGATPETDDWIYTRVFTNGRVQRTLGADGDRLIFCHDCHAATLDSFDAMFFPTEEYRVKTE